MPTFVQIGSTYLNADRINKVDVLTDAAGTATAVTIWMAGGSTHQFGGRDAQQLLDFIRQNKVA